MDDPIRPNALAIKELMKSRGFSKPQVLATKSGLELRTVQRVLQGIHRHDEETLRSIATALRVDLDQIVLHDERQSIEGDNLSFEIEKRADGSRRLLLKLNLSASKNSNGHQKEVEALYTFLRTLLPEPKGLAIIGLTTTTAFLVVEPTLANITALSSFASEASPLGLTSFDAPIQTSMQPQRSINPASSKPASSKPASSVNPAGQTKRQDAGEQEPWRRILIEEMRKTGRLKS